MTDVCLEQGFRQRSSADLGTCGLGSLRSYVLNDKVRVVNCNQFGKLWLLLMQLIDNLCQYAVLNVSS